jgi:hypothetical protein
MAYRIQSEVAATMLAVMAKAGVEGFNHGRILPFPRSYCNKPFARKARNSNLLPLAKAPVQASSRVAFSAVRQRVAVKSGATLAEILYRVVQMRTVYQSMRHGVD